MPKILRLLLRPLLILLVSAPFVALLLAIETGPIVPSADSLSPSELATIEQLLLESAPSSPALPGQQSMELNVEELNLLFDYGLNLTNMSPAWAAQFSIEDRSLLAEMSVEILPGWIPLFLNVTGEFAQNEDLLEISSITIGKIELPEPLVILARERISTNLAQSNPAVRDINELIANIETVEITESQVRVQMAWDPQLVGRISDEAQRFFITDSDRSKIINYYESINEIATTIPVDIRAISLNTLLVPLFTEARDNSQNGSDPIAENRALLNALAIYVNNEDIAQLVGAEAAAQVPPAKFIEVRLQRRQDLAQHIVSIAAISASAGAEFAELLSTTKEAYDARYRSGFSFSDLTANTVGVTLASHLTTDRATALEMQRRIAELQTEADYMPTVGNNRDGISESDFNAIYVDRNSTEFRQRIEEIQAMTDSRPLFQGLN